MSKPPRSAQAPIPSLSSPCPMSPTSAATASASERTTTSSRTSIDDRKPGTDGKHHGEQTSLVAGLRPVRPVAGRVRGVASRTANAIRVNHRRQRMPSSSRAASSSSTSPPRSPTSRGASSPACEPKTFACTKTISLSRSRTSTPSVSRSVSALRSTRAGAWRATRFKRRKALDHLLFDLLDKQDEIFIYSFSNYPVLLQSWTTDRQLLSRALGRIRVNGGTAMYDAVDEAIPLAARRQEHQESAARRVGRQRHRQPGSNPRAQTDHSRERAARVRHRHRRERQPEPITWRAPTQPRCFPHSMPFPFPKSGDRGPSVVFPEMTQGGGQSAWQRVQSDDRVNVAALRDMTDDSGGRTGSHPRRARSQPGDRQHRRRTEQAVLPGLLVGGQEGRKVARHPGGSPERQLPRPCTSRVHGQLKTEDLNGPRPANR